MPRRTLAATAVAVALIAVASRVRAVGPTSAAVLGAEPAWLLVLIGLAAVGPVAGGGLLRAGLHAASATIGRREALRVGAGIRAANLVVRSGGLSRARRPAHHDTPRP